MPAADEGGPVFVAAPPLADEDVQEIAETAAQRIVRLLQRRGLLDDPLVDEPRRQEPPEWRSGALELQCGASQKVLRREPSVVQRGIRCPYPSELGSPLSHSCDRPPIPWGGGGPDGRGERQAAQGPLVVRSMDGDSPELVVKAKPAQRPGREPSPASGPGVLLEGGPGGLAPHRLVPTLPGLQVQVVHGPLLC